MAAFHSRAANMVNQLVTETADAELVRRAKAGELDAFEALTNRYEQRVYSLALRMLRQEQDAEDVTQQTFLSALENLERLSRRSQLSHLAAAHRHSRRAQGHPQTQGPGHRLPGGSDRGRTSDHDTIPHPEYIADWRQSPEQLVQQNEIQRLLDEALAQLDEKHRLVFLLRDVEGLSVKETAEALGLSEANTKVRLLRARLQLREAVDPHPGRPASAGASHAH